MSPVHESESGLHKSLSQGKVYTFNQQKSNLFKKLPPSPLSHSKIDRISLILYFDYQWIDYLFYEFESEAQWSEKWLAFFFYFGISVEIANGFPYLSKKELVGLCFLNKNNNHLHKYYSPPFEDKKDKL